MPCVCAKRKEAGRQATEKEIEKKEKEEMKREKTKQSKKNKNKKQTRMLKTQTEIQHSSLDVPFVKKQVRRRVRMMKSVVFFSVVVHEWLAEKLLVREIPFRERPGSGRQCSTTWA